MQKAKFIIVEKGDQITFYVNVKNNGVEKEKIQSALTTAEIIVRDAMWAKKHITTEEKARQMLKGNAIRLKLDEKIALYALKEATCVPDDALKTPTKWAPDMICKIAEAILEYKVVFEIMEQPKTEYMVYFKW